MKRILISCLVRNNGIYLKYMFKMLEDIENKLFKKFNFQYLFYTNNNTDNSLQILKKEEQKKSNITVIEGELSEEILALSRVKRLYYLRENLLKEILKKEFDYLVIIDTDIYFNSKILEESVNILEKEDYEAITLNTLNHIGLYYDTFAIETKEGKKLKFQNPKVNHNISEKIKFYPKILLKDKIFDVKSSFGGFFLTSSKKIKDSKNTYLKEEPQEEICEHLPFNKNFKIGLVSYITPIINNKNSEKEHLKYYKKIKENKLDYRNKYKYLFLFLFLIIIVISYPLYKLMKKNN